MDSVDENLKDAYEHVKQCKLVDQTIRNIALGLGHASDLAWANNMIDYLVCESDKILDRLENDYSSAGWWKKKVIKSWWNDVGTWTSRIKLNRNMIKLKLDKN